jgi:uncharacterized protein YlzI (FlbEa/FlbD family)
MPGINIDELIEYLKKINEDLENGKEIFIKEKREESINKIICLKISTTKG